MKIRKVFLVLLTLLSFVGSKAQNRTIKGTVAGDGESLIGVTVKIQEIPNIGVVTDIDGHFTLKVPEKGKNLIVSYVGFQSQTVHIGTSSNLTITLKKLDKSLEEVVVIGYGTMRKRDLTGAITSVSSDAIEARTPVNAFDALQGQAAGVQITNSSGSPGAAPDIRIRGTSTFGDGYKPLYVIDGVIQDNIDDLNPSDIKSMEVLKDAASAAIYGSRSGNGVILITTKSGAIGKPKIEIKYSNSIGQIGRIIPHANLKQRSFYDGIRASIGAGFLAFTDTLSAYSNTDVDVFKALFRIARRDQIDISLSGASDNANYFMSLGYYNEDGIMLNSGYQRISWRMNGDYKFSAKTTFGTRLSMSMGNRTGRDEPASFNELLIRAPYYPIYNPDGTFVGSLNDRKNYVAVAVDGINLNQQYNVSNYNYLEYKFSPRLSFKTNVQGQLTLNKTQSHDPQNQVGAYGLYSGADNSILSYNYANENYFNYNYKTNKHNLTGLLGASIQSWSILTSNIRGLDYSSEAIYTLNGVSNFDTKNTYTTISRHAMASVFGRITYSFLNKYLFSSNMREDGSSRFGSNRKWGLFPSISLGWRLSEEKFLKATKDVMSDAKLRVSWGVTGNEAIGNYDALQLYSPGFLFNGINGIASTGIDNPNLGWERTEQYNGGADLSFFNNKIRLSIDVYVKNTSDLLYNVELPKETGYTTLRSNIGAMQSKGFEINLDATLLKTKDWMWTGSINVSKNNSTVVKLANGAPFYTGSFNGVTNNAIYVYEGARVGEIWGYQFQGVFAYDQSNAFTPDYSQQLTPIFVNGFFDKYLLNNQPYTGLVKQKFDSDKTTPLKGGDMNFVDLDGDGVITDNDKRLIACSQPDFTGGFNSTVSYKSISLNTSFVYSIGGEIYNAAEESRNLTSSTGPTPSPAYIESMWLNQGDVTDYHAPRMNVANNRMLPSSFFLEDATYLRLKSLRLSYAFNKKLIQKLQIGNLSIFIYGNNLLTFSRFSGFDPEIPSTGGALSMGIYSFRYPQKKEAGLGININF
ncbi:MAG: TonB-dependent receptor [Bacteroidota bacterium]